MQEFSKNRTIAAGLLVTFFVGFLVASTYRFQHLVYEGNHSFKIAFSLVLIAFASGICLGIALGLLNLIRLPLVLTAIGGGVGGVVLFFSLFGVEDALTTRRLFSELNPVEFHSIRGHCGPYSGRAMIRFYHRTWEPSLENRLMDFSIANRCRMTRFEEITRRNQGWCRQQNEAECYLSWMKVFAEKGYWNPEVRRMFLKRMLELWNSPAQEIEERKIPDNILMEYAIRDHELEMASPSLVKQAGVEEDFTERFSSLKQQEEIDNAVIGKEVIDSVSSTIRTEPTSQFAETSKAMSFRYEKIPELQKSAAELRKTLGD